MKKSQNLTTTSTHNKVKSTLCAWLLHDKGLHWQAFSRLMHSHFESSADHLWLRVKSFTKQIEDSSHPLGKNQWIGQHG